jgi:flagellar secretion chaperone FliS
MSQPTATRQYLITQIQTASKERLVLLLFDGAIRFCEQGRIALTAKQIEPAHIALTKAQEIILELAYGLDREQGGAIAENLGKLYAYCLQRLVQANMAHQTGPIEDAQKVLRGLREGWSGALEKLKQEGKSKPEARSDATASAPAEPVAPAPAAKPAAVPQAPRKDTIASTARPAAATLRPVRSVVPGVAMPRLSVQG